MNLFQNRFAELTLHKLSKLTREFWNEFYMISLMDELRKVFRAENKQLLVFLKRIEKSQEELRLAFRQLNKDIFTLRQEMQTSNKSLEKGIKKLDTKLENYFDFLDKDLTPRMKRVENHLGLPTLPPQLWYFNNLVLVQEDFCSFEEMQFLYKSQYSSFRSPN